MISVYSVVSSIIFYNLSLVVLIILRRNTDFIARYAISTLLLLSILSLIRLLVPIDIAPIIIRSEILVPKLIELLERKISIWPLSIGNTILAVWLTGSLIYGFKICFIAHIAHKSRRVYPKIRNEQLSRVTAKFDKSYTIIISPKVEQPYTFGILKPVIYLPFIEYSDTELYYILLHEVQHIKSHDNLKRIVLLIVEAVFWWNPLSHIAVDEFELLTEYSCDSKLAANMDSDTLVTYLRTIISVLKRLNPDEDKTKPKLAVMFAQTYDIKQRFEVLLRRNDRKPRHIRYAAWLIMLFFFVMSYFIIFQPYYSAPTAYSDVDVSEYQEDAYILFSDGRYYLVLANNDVYELNESDLNYPPCNELMIIGE